jgi:WD40 repeat protein
MTIPSTATGPDWRAGEPADAILRDQRQRWERRQPLLAEEYLALYPALRDDREGWLDLVYAEFCFRVQSGEAPTLEEYQGRFPELREDLRDQFEVHAALASAPVSDPTISAPDLLAPTLPRAEAAGRGEFPSLPGYEIRGILGRGAMGVVYEARQKSLGRLVALKMVLAGEMAGAEELFRLQSEAKALGRLQHPHIVQIFETGTHDGRPFLALEYCAGGSLADRLRGVPLAPRPAGELIETLARAIHSAHEQGVVHRDLKPGNVLLAAAPDDQTDLLARLKITDFGLAKRLDQDGHSRTGDIMGTPNYMAPEQAAGRPQDTGPRTDVFALGAILYELLTGGTPFRSATPWETIRLILTEDPVPPTRLQPRTPADLETICLTCLQKDPARRYQRALALADDLRRWLNGEPVHARPVGRLERLVKWVRRRPADAAVVVVSIVAAVFLLALGSALLEKNLLKSQKDTLAGEVSTLEGLKAASVGEVSRLDRVAALMAYANTMSEVQSAHREFRFPAMREQIARCLPRPGQEDLRGFEWHYANGLCDGGKRAFPGLRCVAYPTDGKRLLTARSDKTLALIEVATGRVAGEFTGLDAEPTCFAFSPDGTTLAATCRNGKLALWDVGRGGKPHLLRGHKGEALHVAAGPKGLFATCGDDGIKVWGTNANPVEDFALEGHKGRVFATAFSPDGKLLVSAGVDGTARVWDVATQKETRKLREGGGGALAVAFSPGGDLVAVARMDRLRTVEVFDRADWKLKHELHGHAKYVRTLAFGQGGRLLASGDQDGVIRVWDAAEGALRLTLPGHREGVSCLTFPPTPGPGGYLASVGKDEVVRLWDATSRPQQRMLGGHDAAVTAIAFSPDSRRLASGDRAKKPVAFVHDVTTGERVPRFPLPHGASLSALGFSADGKRLLAAGSLAGVDVRDWSIEEGSAKPLADLRIAPGSAMAVGTDRLAVCTPDGRIRVHDDAGKELADLPGHGQKVAALAFSRDGTRLASVGSDGIVRVREIASGRLIGERTVAGNIDCLALSADGERLAWAEPDHTMRLWTVGAEAPPLELVGHEGAVNGLSFGPDGRRLASASFDQTVRVWDTFAGREVLRLSLPWSQVNAVAFSPDGTRLAAGGGAGNQGEVSIWFAGPSR